MPCHNDAEYLKETIGSVIAQTFKDWEILLVDDCSTDNSLEIAESFNDERIRIFKNEKNSGAAFSRNVATENARGKYIAFLDADDYWYPTKLEKQVGFMEDNHYLFSAHYYHEALNDLTPRKLIKGPKKMGKGLMKRCSWIGCLTAMYNQEDLGKFFVDPNLKKRNDYAIWLQITKKAPCYMLKDTLAIYRRNASGISSVSVKTKLKWEKEMYRMYSTKSSIIAWYMAIRVAGYTVFKKITFIKTASSPANTSND